MQYRGRFAPSATGPLHLGSIFAALVSYLHAREHDGMWLVRIDDLDSLRCKPAFTTQIIETLQAFALTPDEPIGFQSERRDPYQKAFDAIRDQGLLYACNCSRRTLPRGPYPGHCRVNLGNPINPDVAVRIDTESISTVFNDRFQGLASPAPPGDFIVKRRDGLIAYQLACAVDESIDRINHVIRGIDLLPSTPMQRFISEALNLAPPVYGHFPVLVDRFGAKLSKQTFATPVNPDQPGDTYFKLARLLLLDDTPDPTQASSDWLAYFRDLGPIEHHLPRVASVSAE